MPFANGTNSDSLLALQPDGTWLVLRVPYPLGFFSRGMDGRIDDPNGRLEGPGDLRGLRTECGVAHRRRSWHSERRRQVPAAARSAGEVASMSRRQPSRELSRARRRYCARRHRPRPRRALRCGWGQRFHEDLPERGAGPEIGDYLGLPINDAARLRADSWDAGKWTMLERQCEPHPADYAPRGPASMRISSTVDPVSQDVISWHTTMMWMLPHRAIYMDGRAASVAVRAAQLAGLLDRRVGRRHAQGDDHSPERGLAAPQRRAAERQGHARSSTSSGTASYLTLVTIVKDPVYLTEPFVRTSNWVADAGFQLSPFSCIPTVEIERARDEVPHHLPGENRYLTEFATRHGLPSEAARGGAETMYPDYLTQLHAAGVTVIRHVACGLAAATAVVCAAAGPMVADDPGALQRAACAGQRLRAGRCRRQHHRADRIGRTAGRRYAARGV